MITADDLKALVAKQMDELAHAMRESGVKRLRLAEPLVFGDIVHVIEIELADRPMMFVEKGR